VDEQGARWQSWSRGRNVLRDRSLSLMEPIEDILWASDKVVCPVGGCRCPRPRPHLPQTKSLSLGTWNLALPSTSRCCKFTLHEPIKWCVSPTWSCVSEGPDHTILIRRVKNLRRNQRENCQPSPFSTSPPVELCENCGRISWGGLLVDGSGSGEAQAKQTEANQNQTQAKLYKLNWTKVNQHWARSKGNWPAISGGSGWKALPKGVGSRLR